MVKKRKILLSLICLSIIGGIIFNVIYISNKHEKSVQAMSIKKKLVTEVLVDVKPWPKTKRYNKLWSNDSQKLMVLNLGNYNNIPLVKKIEVPFLNIMKVKQTATVINHASGIAYDKHKVENEFIIKDKVLKRSKPERKQDSAQKINSIKIEQRPIEITKAEHKSENGVLKNNFKKKFEGKETLKVSKSKNRRYKNEKRTSKIHIEPRIEKNGFKNGKGYKKLIKHDIEYDKKV